MKKLVLLSAVLPIFLAAQVRDDFSDGNFTSNPVWRGNTTHFKISSSSAIPALQRPALQLEAPAAGQSYLATDINLTGDLEWQCWIKLSLNTSSGNYIRIYLLSDSAELTSSLHGYFIQAGGAEDSVIFSRQDGMSVTSLLRMKTAFTGNSVNSLRFRATRDQGGNWHFYADPAGNNLLEYQGAVNDLTYPGGNYFGIFCLYTASNLSKYYFDDFYAGPLIIDTVPPELIKATAVNPEEVILIFTEAVDPFVAEDTSLYEVTEGLGSPYAAIRMMDPEQVHLFFDPPLQNGVSYQLVIKKMKDMAGNESGILSGPLLYYSAHPFDVIISEIMADPFPPAGLPEYEYIELLNRSLFEIEMQGWKLSVSSVTYSLPAITIKQGEYLIICDQQGIEALQPFGNVIGLPFFSLANNGATIQLANAENRTVFHLQYDLSWYKDDVKSAGGWALEMTDTVNPCLGELNWMASGDPLGGTPGKGNSFRLPSDDRLYIEKICVTGIREVEITFNQSLDSLYATESWRYNASPGLGNPVLVLPKPLDFRNIRLHFGKDISAGQIYELTVLSGLKNCIGNEMFVSHPELFAITEPTGPYDIILNEILFNPLGSGVDYVEIFNRSGKVIDLAEIMLGSVKETPPNPPDTQTAIITASCRPIFPEQFFVLTSDPDMVESQYYTTNSRAFIKMKSFPAYNNDQGFALLMNQEGAVVDGLHYHENMHYSLLNNYEGVSLERICPDRLGDQPDNWHSAAETAGFGTPGYQNSQFIGNGNDQSSTLVLFPEVFSPDSDGVGDQLGITCNFDAPGMLVTILIFNAGGKLVRRLINNELTGTSGIFSWDGTLDDRTPGSNGIYIVYLEALGMDGKNLRMKKACVLARRR